jgi:hypothetical protein
LYSLKRLFNFLRSWLLVKERQYGGTAAVSPAWGCDGKEGAITYENRDHISVVSSCAVQFLGEGMGQQTTSITLDVRLVLDSYKIRIQTSRRVARK